jgi:hypothetical protein
VGAVLHGPGEGERIATGTGSQILIKATEADTAGSFFLSESTLAPGFPGPPLHRFEHSMRALGEAARSGPLTPEVMGPIAARYDFEPA